MVNYNNNRMKLKVVQGELGGMMEYIKLCMVPFLVSFAFTWIITLNVVVLNLFYRLFL